VSDKKRIGVLTLHQSLLKGKYLLDLKGLLMLMSPLEMAMTILLSLPLSHSMLVI
jgi:hypothetical protein